MAGSELFLYVLVNLFTYSDLFPFFQFQLQVWFYREELCSDAWHPIDCFVISFIFLTLAEY